MPAPPSPDVPSGARPSWRRTVASRLRRAAAWVEPHRGSGVAGFEGTALETTTAERAFDLADAPEHWVALLRDAGLAPSAAPKRAGPNPVTPNHIVRPALRAIPRLWRAQRTPHVEPTAEQPVAGPVQRAIPRLWRALQAPQRTPVLRLRTPSQPERPQAPSSTPVSEPTLHPDEPTKRAQQAPQVEPTAGARPTLRTSEHAESAQQAPQRTPTLKLRAPAQLERPQAPTSTPVAERALRPNKPTNSTQQAPQVEPTAGAGPTLRPNKPTDSAQKAPQRTPALKLRAPSHPERPQAPTSTPVAGPTLRPNEPTKSAQQAPQRSQPRQNRAQANAHTPAPALPGVWPELVRRPSRSAPVDGATLSSAMARQTRIDQEHGAL
jgi:hypothetical protein